MTQHILGEPPSLHLAIIGFVSVVVSIAVALISLGWFFKDGDDSTNSMQEFNRRSGDPYGLSLLTTKFGLWLLVSGGAGYVCFMLLLKAWRFFHQT